MNIAKFISTKFVPLACLGAIALIFPGSLMAEKPTRAELEKHAGAPLYKQVCVACHTVGGGQLVGPDLLGISDRKDEEWLIKFIKSSASVINSGDEYAVALFEKFNKLPMPDAPFDEAQIKLVLDYIKFAGGGKSAEASDATEAPAETKKEEPILGTDEDVATGQLLFQGKQRFENGGPSCISCHDVKNDAIIGGGILARELTTVFSRMGSSGVKAIIGAPPFPVMGQAYKEKTLTDDEIFAIVAFLQRADKEHSFQQPRDYGVKLAITGIGGVVVLLILYSMIFIGRRKQLVNQEIFDRQIKSE